MEVKTKIKCWVKPEEWCEFDTSDKCSKCPLFFQEFAKVVYCNNASCLHFRPIPFKKIIEYCLDYQPLGEDDYYRGICTRGGEVGLEPKNFQASGGRFKFNNCKCYSDKFISGHLDFTKLKPQFVDEDGMKEMDKHKKGTHFYQK